MANWKTDLAVVLDKDGHLTIERANEAHDPNVVFTSEQWADLFASVKASGRTVSADKFVMYDAKGEVVKAAVQRAYKDKSGEERTANAVYSAKQLAAFEPVEVTCILKMRNGKFGSYPVPQIIANTVKYSKKASAERPVKAAAIARVSAAASPPITRVKAK